MVKDTRHDKGGRCYFREQCLGKQAGTKRHIGRSFICVTDVATGKETHVSICNTAKVLVTKHGWHEYEEMIKRGRTASAAEIEGAQEESKRIRYEQVKATKQLWPHGHL